MNVVPASLCMCFKTENTRARVAAHKDDLENGWGQDLEHKWMVWM